MCLAYDWKVRNFKAGLDLLHRCAAVCALRGRAGGWAGGLGVPALLLSLWGLSTSCRCMLLAAICDMCKQLLGVVAAARTCKL